MVNMIKPKDVHVDDPLLMEYVEGGLPWEEVIPLEHHLEGCDRCRIKVERLRALERALIEPVLETPPASLYQQILNKAVKRRITLEELFLSLSLGFVSIFSILAYMVSRYGGTYLTHFLFHHLNISFMLKNGVRNLNRLTLLGEKLMQKFSIEGPGTPGSLLGFSGTLLLLLAVLAGLIFFNKRLITGYQKNEKK